MAASLALGVCVSECMCVRRWSVEMDLAGLLSCVLAAVCSPLVGWSLEMDLTGLRFLRACGLVVFF